MHIFHPSRSLLLVIAVISRFAQFALADFDSNRQWAWIDESCNGKINLLNEASEEYLQLAQTGYDSLGDGISEVGRSTLRSFFGKIDPTGVLIQSKATPGQQVSHVGVLTVTGKYNTLKEIGKDGKKIPYSIYCDGSAFEWVDQDCEGNPIDGQWEATRSDPTQPDLVIKDQKSNNICEDANGNGGNAASQPNGHAIILCPIAFEKRTTAVALRDEVQPPGTLLDNMVSLSSILLHEMTHVALGTQDIRYDAIGCIFLALNSAPKARKNADTYELFSLGKTSRAREGQLNIDIFSAMFLHKNDWSKMGAVQKPKATNTAVPKP